MIIRPSREFISVEVEERRRRRKMVSREGVGKEGTSEETDIFCTLPVSLRGGRSMTDCNFVVIS